jgi:hypothetical protein
VSDAPGPPEAGQKTKPPERPPTAPERGGMRAFLLSVGGLMLLFVPVPGAAVIGLALLVAGVVSGIRARRRARRVLGRAPGSVPAIVIGAIGICFGMAVVAVGVVLAGELTGYQKCRESALTITDRQSCQAEYLPRFERKLHLPEGSLGRYRSLM